MRRGDGETRGRGERDVNETYLTFDSLPQQSQNGASNHHNSED